MTYSEKLKDPRWQKRRLEKLNAAGWKCDHCNAADKTLHIHHGRYVKDRQPWEYDDHELHSLCEDCHKRRHEIESAISGHLAEMTLGQLAAIRWITLDVLIIGPESEGELEILREVIRRTDFDPEGYYERDPQ